MGASLTATRPSARRTRIAELAPFVALALWTLLVTVVLARIGVDSRHVFRDEGNALLLGRNIADDLSLVVGGSLARGPERLTSLLMTPGVWLSDSPTRQVELLHLWTALAQGFVAMPAWLAARELGLGRWQALAPAAVASCGSFAFYGIFTLNTSVGLLTSTLLLWAMIRALRRPGLASDLLVSGTLALTALARIGWAPLVGALVPAVLAAAWLERPGGERAGTWLRRLPGRLRRRHPLLAPAALALALVVLVVGPSTLLGGEQYGGVRLTPVLELSVAWENTRTLGAHLAIGMALVPFVLALPVIVRGLARPADPVEGGFAWLVLGLVIAFSYAYYASMNEDRYFAVLAPPLVLAGALAVFRRPPPLWSVAVSGAVVTVLVATSYSWPLRDVYDYFVAPTSRFFGDVVVVRPGQHLPGSPEAWAVVVALGAAVGAMLAVAVARRPHALGRVGVVGAGLVLAGVLAFELAAMDHPARKFTRQVGMTQLSAEMLELIDRESGGASVRAIAVNGVVNHDLDAQLRQLQAYNASLADLPYRVVLTDDDVVAPPPGIDATIAWDSGRVAVDRAPPAFLLEMGGAARVGFAGEPLSRREPYPWAQLVRLDRPLRIDWARRGAGEDGYPSAGDPVEVRVYPRGRAGLCLSGLVLVHPFAEAAARFRLAGGGHVVRGVLTSGAPRPFELPVPARGPTTYSLTGQARTLSTGGERGPAIFELAVRRCSRP